MISYYVKLSNLTFHVLIKELRKQMVKLSKIWSKKVKYGKKIALPKFSFFDQILLNFFSTETRER